jgi:CRISPR-associated protein (TIGR02710 family)
MERYDDAVGRLYRSLELLVQIRLKEKYLINTSKLDYNQLPEKIQSKYIKQTKTSLLQSYELLVELEDKPLGELFKKQRELIKDKLETRNLSIMAHGLKPITYHDYKNLTDIFLPFLNEGIEQIILPKKSTSIQFPDFLINI